MFGCFPVGSVMAEGCRSGRIRLERMKGCCCKGEGRSEEARSGEANELKEV